MFIILCFIIIYVKTKKIKQINMQMYNLSVGDRVRSIFLSTEGENTGEVAGELVKFLNFVKEDTSENRQDYEDTFVGQLQDSIQRV